MENFIYIDSVQMSTINFEIINLLYLLIVVIKNVKKFWAFLELNFYICIFLSKIENNFFLFWINRKKNCRTFGACTKIV